MKLTFRLTWFALIVSAISLALFVAVVQNSGDTSLAVWFVLFLLLMFVSAPLHGAVFVGTLIQTLKGQRRSLTWVYLYLIAALGGHVAVAASYGAFDEVLSDLAQAKRAREQPEQVMLERALMRGPSSNVADVRSALASGADPNSTTFDGRMPFLVLAASRSDTPVIRALLDAGADPNRRAGIEVSSSQVRAMNPLPLDVAVFSEHEGVSDSVNLLLAAGADPADSLMKLGACRRGEMSLYDLANTLGVDRAVDGNEQTCMHHAADANRVEFMRSLLFDPAYAAENARDALTMSNRFGQYPLDIAVANENFDAALLILRAGGTAKKRWTDDRTLENQSNDPVLEELRRLLLLDSPAQ